MAGNKHRVIKFTALVISFLWQSGKVIWQSTIPLDTFRQKCPSASSLRSSRNASKDPKRSFTKL